MMSDVERGFSYMPEINLNELNLQYVEDSELKQAWKSSRRERLKVQEQKIWDDFIQEQDIVQSVCESDPYQFIDKLPDTYVEEVLSKELNKDQIIDTCGAKIGVDSKLTYNSSDTLKTFVNNRAPDLEDDHNVLHIYHDEVDNDEQSGTDGEALDDSVDTPCTVRENEIDEKPQKRQQQQQKQYQQSRQQQEPVIDKVISKSSDNIASVIENSIYCAKVKDLRIKINEEILSIITSLERTNLSNEDPEDIRKMLKRSTEFCTRFNRIHLYQLQRQVHDAERSCGAGATANHIGAGRHTQLQAQLLRLTSLHHNVLQAFAALHKCVRQGGFDAAKGARDVTKLVRSIPIPPRAPTLYQDDLVYTCDKLDVALDEHDIRMTEVVRSIEEPNQNPYAAKTGQKVKKKSPAVSVKSTAKTASRADGILSMYSLDTLQTTLKGKPSARDSAGGTAKSRGNTGRTSDKNTPKKQVTPKNTKKPPIKKRGRRDADVCTLVESVQSCVSSQASFEKATAIVLKESVRRGVVKNTEVSRKNRANVSPAIRSPSTNTGRSPRTASPNIRTSIATQERSPRAVTPRTPTLPDDCIASYDVTRLLRELCGGDGAGNKKERVSGARNAQLHCVNSTSPQTPTMPQILRILEETIQKKTPHVKPPTPKDTEKYRMLFNISDKTVENLMQYRTKFVQHMLTSVMYANSSVEKPWEMVNCVSDKIINDLLLKCAKEMQLHEFVQQLFECETK